MAMRIARAVVVAAVVFAAAPSAPPWAQQAPGDTANGRALFTQLGCLACHGPEGRGTAAGPSLATGSLPLARFTAYTRSPAGTMPPFGPQVVSDRELADIYAYLTPPVAQSAPAGRVDAGAALYRRYGCYSCHANEAQGGTQGPRIGPDPVSFPRFAWYLRHPTGQMPPYTAAVMSDQELADVYAFLQARPQPTPVSGIPLLEP